MRSVSDTVEDDFGYAEMRIVSFEDLFGGKLHAALDRQHPRDLYDVKLLYDNEGLTDALFRTLLVYIASSSRPSHELLNPNLIDLDQPYTQEFEDMTRTPVSLEELLSIRKRLIADIQSRFDENTKRFLLSLHDGLPDFDAIGRPEAANLPAVRWKLINLKKTEKAITPRNMLSNAMSWSTCWDKRCKSGCKRDRPAPATVCFTVCNAYSWRKHPWPLVV